MCNLHPPIESPYYNEDMFNILENEINQFQAQGHVIVCGDVNARTGNDLDTINTQGDKYIPGSDNISSPNCPPRNNYDKTTNKHGAQLLKLCRSLGLYIVNGRVRGDSYGRYTYGSPLGNSAVDYFITDLSLESLRAFTVSLQTPLSDHCKITLLLARSTPNQEELTPNKLHPIKKRYKWKENSIETYQNAIKQQKIQQSLDCFLEKQFQHNSVCVNEAVKNLNHIFDLTASLSNLKVSNKKTKKKKYT